MMHALLNGQWLPLCINTVLQSLLVLAATAIVLICARKASAAQRHLVAMAALGTLLLIPLMPLVMPAPKPVMQVSASGADLQRSPVRKLSSSVRIEPVGVAAGSSHVSPPASSAGEVSAASSPGRMVSSETTSAVASHAAEPGALVRFVPCLAALWLTGVLLVFVRLLIGFHRIRRIVQCCASVLSAPLLERIQTILSEVGFSRPLLFLQASDRDPVSVPMTWGVRKPTLLLPADAEEWPVERLRVVVLHELGHIRRHDWLTQMFGQVVCALYWFHPLVWMLNRHTQIEAERACDDAVLLAGVRAKEYAGHLLDVVKTMQTGRQAPSAAVAMARRTQVRYRLQSILNAHRSRQSNTRSVRTLVLLITALLLCAISCLRPFAWAGGHKQGTSARQQPAIGPVVTLPNGTSVELVAVGSSPLGEGDDWWTPDGKPILELPREAHSQFASRESGFAERLRRRSLFFRLKANPAETREVDFSVTGYVVDPTQQLQTDLYRYGRNYRNEAKLLPRGASTGIVLLGLPQTETRCTYRFGLATGPWETIATTRFALNPTPDAISVPATAIKTETLLSLDDNPHLSYQEQRGREHTVSLLGGHAPLGDVARRIIALDKDGQEVALETYEDIRGGTQPFPVRAQARIVELRLQTRPYQWAEFKNIRLEPIPGLKTPSIATPPALSAFRHTFACGITLTVPAVTEKKTEGGLWWKPDGQKLAGPLKEYAQTIDFQAWPEAKRPRLLLVHLQSPRMLSYQSTVRFTSSIPDGWDSVLSKVQYSIYKGRDIFTQLGGDFPPNLQRTTLRYGVAAGPWKTAADIPMPQDVRHTDDVVDQMNSDLSMELPDDPKAGELPKLHYTTVAGESRDIPFNIQDTSYLTDVARRFVAVDTAGHVFTLPFDTSEHMSVDKAGNYIPLDPANAGKTHLPVSAYQHREFGYVNLSFGNKYEIDGCPPVDLTKIREFRLEVCPYEWAELRNIALQPAKGGMAH